MVRNVASNIPMPLDISIYQGDTFRMRLGVYESDGTEADLTGMTARAQIRPTPTDLTVLAEFATQINGSDVDLLLSSDVTAGLAAGGAAWDVQLTSATDVTTLAFGSVSITPEVTRDA